MKIDLQNSNLTAVQLAAALMVVFCHSYPLGNGGADWLVMTFQGRMMGTGGIAVGTFLFLSGFLTGRFSISSIKEGGVCARFHDLLSYALRRVLRVFPSVAFAVFLAMFVIGPLFTDVPWDRYVVDRQFWGYCKNLSLYRIVYELPGVFEHNVYRGAVNGSLWVIPWQMLCYGFVALAGLFGIERNRWVVSILLMVAWILYFMQDVVFVHPYWGLNWRSGIRLIAIFTSGWWFRTWEEKIRLSGWMSLGGGLLLPFLLQTPVRDLAFAFVGGYVLLWLIFDHPQNGLRALPRISLGIFVLSFPLQQALTALFGGRMAPELNFLLTAVLVIPLSWIEYMTIEKAAERVGKSVQDFLDSIFLKRSTA